jgi:hypothetical protein
VEIPFLEIQRKTLYWIIALLAITGILVVLTLGNYQYSKNSPGGTDFLVHWVGTREYFTEGLSPYSDQVALKIQQMVYGRAALPGEHELRVAYPFYSVILFFPFALISNFTLSRAIWMTILEIGLIGLTLISIQLTTWRPKNWMLIILLLFSLAWYHAMRALINGNVIILIALGIAAVFYAIKVKVDELAGVLLAVVTIKPQVVLLVVIFVLFWALFQKRYRIIGWFFITLVLLMVTSSLLIPDWIIQNVREILRYPGYNPPGTPASALATWFPAVGPRIGTIISLAALVIIFVEWWLARHEDFRHFLWTGCLTIVLSVWSGIQTDPGNFIIMVPAIILFFSILYERWPKTSNIIVASILGGIFVLIWLIFIFSLNNSYQPIQNPVLFFPLPLLLFILLYWIRFWAIRPPKLFYDTFHQDEDLSNL